MRARTTPRRSIPSSRAAARLTSAMRPASYGPRSFTRNSTLRPLRRFSTRTIEPSGSVRCAIVIASGSKGSPLAVGRDSNRAP